MVHPLISPEQSQSLILLASVALAILGAALGFHFKGVRGLVAALCGPLVFGLWLVHGALVARFGMDSLALLAGEAMVFIALGALLGTIWKGLSARNTTEKKNNGSNLL